MRPVHAGCPMRSSPVPQSCLLAVYSGPRQWPGKRRRCFIDRRLPGLYDELRPGRPRSIKEERIVALLKRTSRVNRRAEHTGLYGRQPRGAAHPNQRFIGCFRPLQFSPIA